MRPTACNSSTHLPSKGSDMDVIDLQLADRREAFLLGTLTRGDASDLASRFDEAVIGGHAVTVDLGGANVVDFEGLTHLRRMAELARSMGADVELRHGPDPLDAILAGVLGDSPVLG